jgi:tetratricopeptide (TPR) repeat protein
MRKDDPQSVEPALLIGQVYLRTQQNDKALAVTEAALKEHPKAPELLERLAVLKINRGDWPAARRLLQVWLAADPKAGRPCWLLGRCALGELKYAEAVDWLEKAVAIEPHNPHYLGFLGAALLKSGTAPQRERAAAVLAQAVDRAPEAGEWGQERSDARAPEGRALGEYHELYGQALESLGRNETARQQYLLALDADPSRISAYLAAGSLAGRLNCPGAAAFFPTLVRAVQQRAGEEKLLRRQVWQHPEDLAGRLNLARFFCRTARLALARDQLEQAAAQQPAAAEARELLATVRRSLEAQ